MNKFLAYKITNASLFKNCILGALIRYSTSTLQEALIVHFGRAMLMALRCPVRHKLIRIQLAPVHFSTGKGPTDPFNADGALDNFKPRTGIHQPLHQAEVAPGHGLQRPQPLYKAPHGLFGNLVELDQLLQLVA